MANPDRNVTGEGHTRPDQHIQPQGPQDIHRSSGQVDLNTASEQDLAEIDMIGRKLAHTIVQVRGQRGSFRTWEELRQVPGLDPMKIAELQRAARLGD
jgi:competence ComEA-like helix-hairpin-helix protein